MQVDYFKDILVLVVGGLGIFMRGRPYHRRDGRDHDKVATTVEQSAARR